MFACSSKEDKLRESFMEQSEELREEWREERREEFYLSGLLKVDPYYCVLLAFKYDMQTNELYEMLKEYHKAMFPDINSLFETRIDSISSKLSIFVNKYDIDKKTLANIIIDYELLSKYYGE